MRNAEEFLAKAKQIKLEFPYTEYEVLLMILVVLTEIQQDLQKTKIT